MRSPEYCNLNGCYGCGPYQQPDYASLPDLLSAMDRLGVAKTIAFHNCARDLHPVYGNQLLLNDIRQSSAAAQRVIPALVASPAMLVGYNDMDFLKDCFQKKAASCIVLFPKTNRFRLREIIPVLRQLAPWKPLVLIDVTELNGPEELDTLMNLAASFPDMSFVVRRVMWHEFPSVLDIMRQVGNIYLDTSWLHTRDTLRIVRDELGMHRLLFGLGFRSHAGAAMAALSYADLPQEEKDAIACDNLYALLRHSAADVPQRKHHEAMENQVKNRFWNDFLDEQGVKDALVIDAHSHIGPFARGWFLRENGVEAQIRVLEKDMRRFGIQLMISQPETALFGTPIEGNRIVEAALLDKTDHFRGNLVFNPVYSELYTEEVLDNFFHGGYFCGIKILPEYLNIPVDDPRYFPIYRYADKHHMHILVHTWEGTCGTANQVAGVACRYPNAIFILAHTGGGTTGRHQCEAIAQDSRYGNCMFEFCGSFTTEVEWVNTLQKIDYHRVVFGTDTYAHDIAWELGRLLSMDLPDEQIEAILGLNMQRILNLSDLPKHQFLKKSYIGFL